MSFYRTLLAAGAALVVTTAVFADNTSMQNPSDQSSNANQSTATQAAPQQVEKINLNKANAKELMKVKGINAAKAKAIIAYRKKHGEFKSTDELANVKGLNRVKTTTLKSIESQVTVE